MAGYHSLRRRNVPQGSFRCTIRKRIPQLLRQRRLVAYLDGLPPAGTQKGEVAQLRAYQEETQKELEALMSSILDKAFKGEL